MAETAGAAATKRHLDVRAEPRLQGPQLRAAVLGGPAAQSVQRLEVTAKLAVANDLAILPKALKQAGSGRTTLQDESYCRRTGRPPRSFEKDIKCGVSVAAYPTLIAVALAGDATLAQRALSGYFATLAALLLPDIVSAAFYFWGCSCAHLARNLDAPSNTRAGTTVSCLPAPVRLSMWRGRFRLKQIRLDRRNPHSPRVPLGVGGGDQLWCPRLLKVSVCACVCVCLCVCM